ncbi:mitochondrial transcription factor 1 [Trichomonascus vanleenenianus]|uniref:RNA polymerase specificity factor n=1 Tax=Trichomonascus vanleenenianus TaxID=2268995 RepID=UPI003ECAED30
MLVRNCAGEWMAKLKTSHGHKFLANYEAGVEIVKKLALPETHKSNLTVIEGYAGNGVWSAALHNTLKPANHVILEPHLKAFTFLKSLESPENTLKVHSIDPFRWQPYNDLVSEGVYTPVKHPRTEINPFLLFTANLSNLQGEQLAAQYLNCITNMSWLQQYGRVRMLLWVRSATAAKFLFTAGEPNRSRISIQAESSANVKLVVGDSAQENGLGYDAKLAKPLITLDKLDYFSNKIPAPVLIQLDPLEKMPDYLDSFEYVIKMLCVLRNKPLGDSLSTLGAGAYDDLAPQLPAEMLEMTVRDLTLDQLKLVVEKFEMWPFKPEILHDFYSSGENSNINGGFYF